MRVWTKIVPVLILLLGAPFASVAAAGSGPSLHVGIGQGLLVSTQSVTQGDAIELGVGYDFGTLWSLEFTHAYAVRRDGHGERLRAQQTALRTVAAFREHGRWQPFVSVGVGMHQSRYPGANGLTRAANNSTSLVGAGVQVRLDTNWLLRLRADRQQVYRGRHDRGNAYQNLVNLQLAYYR